MKGLFDKNHLFTMQEGIILFNAQKYWECHEDLEHHWLEEPGPVRNVYWAVIQVAASLLHFHNQNLTGARGLIFKAKQKFDRCEALFVESDILNENLSWSLLKSIVRSIPAEPELNDFIVLSQFKFKDPTEWSC